MTHSPNPTSPPGAEDLRAALGRPFLVGQPAYPDSNQVHLTYGTTDEAGRVLAALNTFLADRPFPTTASPDRDVAALREAVAGIADYCMTSEAHHPGYVLISTKKFEQLKTVSTRVLQSAPAGSGDAEVTAALRWHPGVPPKPWCEEWFIAKTTYGDKVVLRALPEEYTYDFETADATYIKADKIKQWMQFPDGEYIEYVAPTAAPPLPTREGAGLDREAVARALARVHWPFATPSEQNRWAEAHWQDELHKADAILSCIAEGHHHGS